MFIPALYNAFPAAFLLPPLKIKNISEKRNTFPEMRRTGA